MADNRNEDPITARNRAERNGEAPDAVDAGREEEITTANRQRREAENEE